jgi:hypothetical protein
MPTSISSACARRPSFARTLARTSLQIYNRIASRLVLTPISMPVWLIIILLSPLDAYAAARDMASHLARH